MLGCWDAGMLGCWDVERDNGTTGQRDNGTTGQRDNGTTEQRNNGTTEQRNNGTTACVKTAKAHQNVPEGNKGQSPRFQSGDHHQTESKSVLQGHWKTAPTIQLNFHFPKS